MCFHVHTLPVRPLLMLLKLLSFHCACQNLLKFDNLFALYSGWKINVQHVAKNKVQTGLVRAKPLMVGRVWSCVANYNNLLEFKGEKIVTILPTVPASA